MHAQRTKVFVTIDTECSEERLIGGRVRRPLGYSEIMWGRSHETIELGISMIARELCQRDLTATFFVEPLCSRHFGEEGLSEVVQFLLSNNQDVQLHLHPNFERPEWRLLGSPAPEDNIGRLPVETQRRLIQEGADILVRCGAPRPVGFRAGNFGAANNTLDILSDCGILVDSSYNAFCLGDDCDIRFPGRPNDAFALPSGLWVLPMSNVAQPRGGLRHLAVTALSTSEMHWSITALARLGVEHVTILTHPDEFFVLDSVDPYRARANRINVRRLTALLDFLAVNSDWFEVCSIGQWAATLPARAPVAPGDGPHPRLGVLPWLNRQREQALKRLDMQPRPARKQA